MSQDLNITKKDLPSAEGIGGSECPETDGRLSPSAPKKLNGNDALCLFEVPVPLENEEIPEQWRNESIPRETAQKSDPELMLGYLKNVVWISLLPNFTSEDELFSSNPLSAHSIQWSKQRGGFEFLGDLLRIGAEDSFWDSLLRDYKEQLLVSDAYENFVKLSNLFVHKYKLLIADDNSSGQQDPLANLCLEDGWDKRAAHGSYFIRRKRECKHIASKNAGKTKFNPNLKNYARDFGKSFRDIKEIPQRVLVYAGKNNNGKWSVDVYENNLFRPLGHSGETKKIELDPLLQNNICWQIIKKIASLNWHSCNFSGGDALALLSCAYLAVEQMRKDIASDTPIFTEEQARQFLSQKLSGEATGLDQLPRFVQHHLRKISSDLSKAIKPNLFVAIGKYEGLSEYDKMPFALNSELDLTALAQTGNAISLLHLDPQNLKDAQIQVYLEKSLLDRWNGRICLRPLDIVKISKYNLRFKDEDLSESRLGKLKLHESAAYSDNSLKVDMESVVSLIEGDDLTGGLGKEDMFRVDKLFDGDKWNSLLLGLRKLTAHKTDSSQCDLKLHFFGPSREILSLFKGYNLALETLERHNLKKAKPAANSFSDFFDGKSALIASDASKRPIQILPADLAPQGLLRENAHAFAFPDPANPGQYLSAREPIGLLPDQKTFCCAALIDSYASQWNTLALNGPPGNGKTTALQAFVASSVVSETTKFAQNLCNGIEDPAFERRIIYGASATHQAKSNIIAGFKHSQVHSASDAGIYKRWIQMPVSFRAGESIRNVPVHELHLVQFQGFDYGFELSGYAKANAVAALFDNPALARKCALQYILHYDASANGTAVLTPTQAAALQTLASVDLNGHFSGRAAQFNLAMDPADCTPDADLPIQLDNRLRKLASLLCRAQNASSAIRDFIQSANLGAIRRDSFLSSLASIGCHASCRKLANALPNEFTSEALAILEHLQDNICAPLCFHLSMRLREGYFLRRILREKNLAGLIRGKGAFKVRQWHELSALLTPVFVSTLHSLSSRIALTKSEPEGYTDEFAIGFIDCLLLDEAGQIPLEVGALGLLAAKKTIAIGDTCQLEPIWTMESRELDKKLFCSMLPANLEPMFDTWNCSDSSIMRIAQSGAPWKQCSDLSDGLYLLEHMRCPIEIISYCDKLKYKSNLRYTAAPFYWDPLLKQPAFADLEEFSKMLAKSSAPAAYEGRRLFENIVPDIGPLMFCKVSGTRTVPGKRASLPEAQKILEFVDSHLASFESALKKPLNQILAILSPFRMQCYEIRKTGQAYPFPKTAESIAKACSEQQLSPAETKDKVNDEVSRLRAYFGAFDTAKSEQITIGTVHSLQGAERDIVLFSNVYAGDDKVDVPFADKQDSILNVAVSRAKRTFVLFGDDNFFAHLLATNPDGATAKLYAHIRQYELHALRTKN